MKCKSTPVSREIVKWITQKVGKLFHIPSLIVDVLGWFFYDENIQKKMISQYLGYLKRGTKIDAQK